MSGRPNILPCAGEGPRVHHEPACGAGPGRARAAGHTRPRRRHHSRSGDTRRRRRLRRGRRPWRADQYPAARRFVAAADDLRPYAATHRGREGLPPPRARVRHPAGADCRGRLPRRAAPVVAPGRLYRGHGAIGSLDRAAERYLRPGQAARATSGASFPSGHAVAASVTVVAAVIVLVPAGRRAPWAVAAATFSILMGLSRAYLGAHWLSDALAGILLGTSCALVTVLVVGHFQQRQGAPSRWPAGDRPVGIPPPDRAGERRGAA